MLLLCLAVTVIDGDGIRCRNLGEVLRCNHAGRYVIRLGDATKSQWSGTVARHKQAQRSLDSGATDFAVVAGSGATETFTIVPRNPGAAKDIAKYISTIVFVQQ